MSAVRSTVRIEDADECGAKGQAVTAAEPQRSGTPSASAPRECRRPPSTAPTTPHGPAIRSHHGTSLATDNRVHCEALPFTALQATMHPRHQHTPETTATRRSAAARQPTVHPQPTSEPCTDACPRTGPHHGTCSAGSTIKHANAHAHTQTHAHAHVPSEVLAAAQLRAELYAGRRHTRRHRFLQHP